VDKKVEAGLDAVR